MAEKPKQEFYPRIAIERLKEVKEYVGYTFEKQQVLVLKMFYFFGLSSLSLKVVYMPLYFKQVGLPASYAGILAGIPPFIRGGGALFLGILADKLNLRRNLFLLSLIANMVIPLLCLIPRIEYPACDLDFTEEPITDPLGVPYENVGPQNGMKQVGSAQILENGKFQNRSALGRSFAIKNTTFRHPKEQRRPGAKEEKYTNPLIINHKVSPNVEMTTKGKNTVSPGVLLRKKELESRKSKNGTKKNGKAETANTKKRVANEAHIEKDLSEVKRENMLQQATELTDDDSENKKDDDDDSENKKDNDSEDNKKESSEKWPEVKHLASFHRRITRSVIRDVVRGDDSENLGIFEFYRRTIGRRTFKKGEKKSEKKSAEIKSNNATLSRVKNKVQKKKTPQESHEAMMAIFYTLLLLLIIGEFLGGPMRSLSDLAVLEALGGDKSNYGDIALWMQVGKIFLAPLILVLIRSYPLHVCDVLKDDYEYSLYPLSAFIAVSMIFGCSIKFNQEEETVKIRPEDEVDADKTLYEVIFTFKTFTILVLSFFAGGLSAVHYTFIFWYLTDLSPKDSAMVIAVVIVLRDIVSSISYKMSGRTLGVLGPVNTLHVALLLYIISFLSYAVMKNPWFAIIPEIVQYIVFPLAYSSFVVYLGSVTPKHLNATVQGIYQCLYYGIGFGVGPLVAGFLFEHVGGAYTFLVFAGISFGLLLFSLARHAITRYMDRLDDSAYKPVPEPEDSDEEAVTMAREEADY